MTLPNLYYEINFKKWLDISFIGTFLCKFPLSYSCSNMFCYWICLTVYFFHSALVWRSFILSIENIFSNFVCLSCSSPSPAFRWRRPAARRCARLNPTWGPTTSALWARCLGTLNCQTLTAMGSLLILAVVWENPSQRTTRNRLPQNLSSHLLPKELTCTPELSSLSPSSSLMWFIGPYTCDYLALLFLLPTLVAYKAFQLTTEKCESLPKRVESIINVFYINLYRKKNLFLYQAAHCFLSL